jgi:4-carboxymuconolactone decarboxylase
MRTKLRSGTPQDASDEALRRGAAAVDCEVNQNYTRPPSERNVMARIPLITTTVDLTPAQQTVAAAVLKVFGHIRGPFSVLLHSPQLAEQLLPLVTFVRQDNVVDARLRFVGILTAVRENRADYVWAAQVEQARKNGIRDEVIEVIRDGRDPAALAADEREIMTYVRELLGTKRVTDALFNSIRSQYGVQWLVELTAIVNFFAFVSGICNAFEVPPPPGGDKLPQPANSA